MTDLTKLSEAELKQRKEDVMNDAQHRIREVEMNHLLKVSNAEQQLADLVADTHQNLNDELYLIEMELVRRTRPYCWARRFNGWQP